MTTRCCPCWRRVSGVGRVAGERKKKDSSTDQETRSTCGGGRVENVKTSKCLWKWQAKVSYVTRQGRQLLGAPGQRGPWGLTKFKLQRWSSVVKSCNNSWTEDLSQEARLMVTALKSCKLPKYEAMLFLRDWKVKEREEEEKKRKQHRGKWSRQ